MKIQRLTVWHLACDSLYRYRQLVSRCNEGKANITKERLRKLEPKVSSTRRTADALDTNFHRIWMWRRGATRLKPAELETLEQLLKEQIRERVSSLEEIVSQ